MEAPGEEKHEAATAASKAGRAINALGILMKL
jgi:hypothetical protein